MPIQEDGIIEISDGVDQDPLSPPTVKDLFIKIEDTRVINNLNNIIVDSVYVNWSVENASSIELKIQKVNSSMVVFGDEEVIDVSFFNQRDGYLLVLDKDFGLKITIAAKNPNTEPSQDSRSIIIKKASSNSIPSDSIVNQENGFFIEKAGSDYDFNAVKLTLLLDKKGGVFSFPEDGASLDIFLNYTSNRNRSWTPIALSGGSTKEIKDAGDNIINYKFIFGSNGSIKINPPQNGGTIFFYCRLVTKSADGQANEYRTKEEFLFFDTVELQTNQANVVLDSSSSKPAKLKYEIKTTISEMYALAENIVGKNGEKIKNNFIHYFLDSKKFKGKNYSDSSFVYYVDGSLRSSFIYEASPKNGTNTQGYFYPACVSEILPCINIVLDANGKNNCVTLFWKIIDDFYDYTFFNGNINIKTNELKISVEYLDAGVYKEILSDVLLSYGADKNYDPVENKFFIKISKDNRELKNASLFFNISELDNQNKNLRIVVKSHKVTVSTPFLGTFDYSYNKLLITPEWTHLLYDQFIPSSSRDSLDKKFSINLDSPILRGIVLPDKAFKIFDILKGISYGSGISGDPFVIKQDYKILYKLFTEVNAFYLDPIREGTITYIDLPNKSDSVFLIPPSLTIPPPNLDQINGIQAKAEVVLNEYGKIGGIKIIDPGSGYSFFKDSQAKREQTFIDLIPVIKSTYQIVSSNLNVNKQTLTLVNNSFSRLKASIDGGTLLSQAATSSRVLDSEQQAILEDYKQRNNFKDDSNIEESRDSIGYNNTRTVIKNNVSIQILDPEWYAISSLYGEKYNNPLENLSIYNQDTDPAAESIDPSSLSPNVQNASVAIENPEGQTVVQNNTQIPGTSTTSETFALNYLTIYTDSSPSISLINNDSAPPWLTLLPKEYRSDGSPAYGTLANMLPRAYNLYNRLSVGINNLNEVRVMIPMIWAVDFTTSSKDYYLPIDQTEDENKIIEWSQDGTRKTFQQTYSYYQPINSSIGVSASRSVGKVWYTNLDRIDRGLENSSASEFKISSEYGSSASFAPFVHPWMEKAFPEFYLRSYKRKFLGIVTEQSYSCSSYTPYQENGISYISCAGVWGDPYAKATSASSIPVDIGTTNTRFEFFGNGTISASPDGTARALSVHNGAKNGRRIFCSESCGTQHYKTIDFKYTNMYPGTVRI
jgi:hypothetical protein